MFVVLEGGEGCGKTTQGALLAAHLTALGWKVHLTREPGGTPLAENIRSLFKQVQTTGDEPTPLTELYLVMAARAQHLDRVVRPALALGEVVICDRFLDSSYVYQGARGGLPLELIDEVAKPVLGTTVPNLTVVLDLDTARARARVTQRVGTPADPQSHTPDRLDAMDAATFAQVSVAFRELLTSQRPYPCGVVPKRVLVDASGTPDEVFARLKKAVDEAWKMAAATQPTAPNPSQDRI